MGNKIRELFGLSAEDYGDYGAKAVNLSILQKNGYNIPPGHVIHRDMFEDIDTTCDFIWKQISGGIGTNPLIARSSAIGEDGTEYSFAGIFESVLNIRTLDDLKAAVRKCLSSYHTERADEYRFFSGLKFELNGMCVLVQEMVLGEKSGVIFTANPVSGNRGESIIEAGYGLNMGIVDGTVIADRYMVTASGKINMDISPKKIMYSLRHFEIIMENVEEPAQYQPCLSDDEIHVIWKMGIEAEKIFGYPCDIEWTIVKGKIYILQCRPITFGKTTATQPPYDCGIPDDAECSLLDRYSEPACCCYLSLLESWQESIYLSFYDKKRHTIKPLMFYFNRVYWNQAYQRKFFDDIPNTFIKKIKMFLLMTTGSQSWYRRIGRYKKLLQTFKENYERTITIKDEWIILEQVINVFCNYIGKDHYRFLGLAQVSYGLLEKRLNGFKNRKEIIAGLIEMHVSKNMTSQSNHELFGLSRLAKKYGIESEVFKNKFGCFIEKHGHRGTSCDDLYAPHWADEPDAVLNIIKQFMLNSSESSEDFFNNHKKTKHSKIKNRKLTRKPSIAFLAKVTSHYMALREDQRYYFDMSWLLIRRLLLSIGDKLCEAGLIENPKNIFHLTISEIRLLAQSDKLTEQKDWRHIIETRIQVFEKNAKITPPYLIRSGSIYFGQSNLDKKSFKATGISGGIAAGPVCVISSADDLGKVSAGEIAVVSTFHPSWTPILGLIGGLIMNYGNILSHGAVVAREYRIPVVIFNGMATNVLENGQFIEINGDTGRVRVL